MYNIEYKNKTHNMIKVKLFVNIVANSRANSYKLRVHATIKNILNEYIESITYFINNSIKNCSNHFLEVILKNYKIKKHLCN